MGVTRNKDRMACTYNVCQTAGGLIARGSGCDHQATQVLLQCGTEGLSPATLSTKPFIKTTETVLQDTFHIHVYNVTNGADTQ